MTGSSSKADNWNIATPTRWPLAPQEMSFSTLHQVEACPRQWALLHAEYAHLGAARGYPQCSSFAALRGRVVHQALLVVTGELAAAGCAALGDPQALAVLRTMGGFTVVITRIINEVLANETSNFRMRAHAASFRLKFIRELPAIRERLQLILSRLRLDPVTGGKGPASRRPPLDAACRGLGHGVYQELVLRSKRLGWTGVADLIELTDSHVQITEFKTSEYSDDHKTQLYTYAVLWCGDERLNPACRIADRLVLSYPGKNISLPQPPPDELRVYEKELVERSQSARVECSRVPPPAKPGSATCPRCQVRHLCAEYWTSQSIKSPEDSAPPQFLDCEILADAPRGPWSWSATLLRVPAMTTVDLPRACVLHVRDHDLANCAAIASKMLIRLLGCHIDLTDHSAGESELSIVTTPSTEIFRLCADEGAQEKSPASTH